MTTEKPEPLPPPTPKEGAIVSQLSGTQRQIIDAALLAEVQMHWRKVAMVVACAMSNPGQQEISDRPSGLSVKCVWELDL
jgi:hypothetical protein